MGQVLSVVDYEAWRKGYLPPSEHVLIDQLSYRDAKVLTGCDFEDYGFWVVIKGERPRREIIKKIIELLSIEVDFYEPEPETQTDDPAPIAEQVDETQ